MESRLIVLFLLFCNASYGVVTIGMSPQDIQSLFNLVQDLSEENPQTATNEPTQEVWNSATGSWVEEKVNPTINGGGIPGHPIEPDMTPEPENPVIIQPENIPETLITTTTTTPTTPSIPTTSSSQGDQDNDVPTLKLILAKLDTLDQDNDNFLLEQILEELKGEEQDDPEQAEQREDITSNVKEYELESKHIPFPELNPFKMNPGEGTLPTFEFQVPTISGESETKVINFNDSKFTLIFSIVALCTTGLFIYHSVKFTAYSSAVLISS